MASEPGGLVCMVKSQFLHINRKCRYGLDNKIIVFGQAFYWHFSIPENCGHILVYLTAINRNRFRQKNTLPVSPVLQDPCTISFHRSCWFSRVYRRFSLAIESSSPRTNLGNSLYSTRVLLHTWLHENPVDGVNTPVLAVGSDWLLWNPKRQ